MTFENVNEVVEAFGAEEANKRLAEGWTLLAVVQGTVPEAQSHIKYVLGRKIDPDEPQGEYVRGRWVPKE